MRSGSIDLKIMMRRATDDNLQAGRLEKALAERKFIERVRRAQTPFPGRYVGLPFKDDGLDFDGVHCWGLVRLVLAVEKGIGDLPAYDLCSAADLISAARQFRDGPRFGPWLAVARNDIRAFDCVVMAPAADDRASRSVAGHIGIMVDGKRVLHISRATDSMIMPLGHPLVRSRIQAFYRHKDIA